MPTGCLLPLLPTTTIFTKNMATTTRSPLNYSLPRRSVEHNSVRCKATSSSSIVDFDLYDLLGVDCSANQSEIKTAYRTLQKRCHPDIAGPPGHDMAIILNEAYKLLSDPGSRSAYDREQAKVSELRGYTGKTLYSEWFGSESEERAVFVDEVKCIGCLKCALLAEKTFAIESVHGRARVVAQWADPENKIQAAIDACPVDCISTVDRSDLAALEFLMSKQPRGNVRVGGGNNTGARVANIFVDVKKFQSAYAKNKNNDKANTHSSKETDLQREARMSAYRAIRSISNWLYWQSPVAHAATSGTLQNTPQDDQTSEDPNLKKLREAAAAWKQASENPKAKRQSPSSFALQEDYWVPSTHALPTTPTKASAPKVTKKTKSSAQTNQREEQRIREYNRRNPVRLGFSLVTATFAAIVVRLHAGSTTAAGGITEHIRGPLPLDIVNSYWLQAALAGVTWYLIGLAVVDVVEKVGRKR